MYSTLELQVKLKQAVQAALGFQPHAVLTVDSKGFSFRFLKHLRGNTWQQFWLRKILALSLMKLEKWCRNMEKWFLQLGAGNKGCLVLCIFSMLRHHSGPGKVVKQDLEDFLSLWIMSCVSFLLRQRFVDQMD